PLTGRVSRGRCKWWGADRTRIGSTGRRDLSDVKAERGLALEDFVVVVVVAKICGAEFGARVEVTETLERVVGLERLLGQDEEVGLTGAGVVAVHSPGLADRLRDALFEVPELVEVAVGRAGDRKDEEELHSCESRCPRAQC